MFFAHKAGRIGKEKLHGESVMGVWLTKHALGHLRGRLSGYATSRLLEQLAEGSVGRVLFHRSSRTRRRFYDEVKGGYIKLNKTRYQYLLFFSWQQGFWFVAVVDENDGGVITLQPAVYSRRKEHIKPEHLAEALATVGLQLTGPKTAP